MPGEKKQSPHLLDDARLDAAWFIGTAVNLVFVKPVHWLTISSTSVNNFYYLAYISFSCGVILKIPVLKPTCPHTT